MVVALEGELEVLVEVVKPEVDMVVALEVDMVVELEEELVVVVGLEAT